jgi:hypothetical protein
MPVVYQLLEDGHAADARGEGEQRGRRLSLRVVVVALRTRVCGPRHEPRHVLTREHHERARAEEV